MSFLSLPNGDRISLLGSYCFVYECVSNWWVCCTLFNVVFFLAHSYVCVCFCVIVVVWLILPEILYKYYQPNAARWWEPITRLSNRSEHLWRTPLGRGLSRLAAIPLAAATLVLKDGAKCELWVRVVVGNFFLLQVSYSAPESVTLGLFFSIIRKGPFFAQWRSLTLHTQIALDADGKQTIRLCTVLYADSV